MLFLKPVYHHPGRLNTRYQSSGHAFFQMSKICSVHTTSAITMFYLNKSIEKFEASKPASQPDIFEKATHNWKTRSSWAMIGKCFTDLRVTLDSVLLFNINCCLSHTEREWPFLLNKDLDIITHVFNHHHNWKLYGTNGNHHIEATTNTTCRSRLLLNRD